MAKITKTQRVIEHLLKRGSITSWEAIQLYGATRLSAIIFNLRKKYNINTFMIDDIDRYGNESRYAKYVLKEDINGFQANQ